MGNPERRIALAHDTFTQIGGAERVVKVLHELYPEAPVFCVVADPSIKNQFAGMDIRTSQLQPLYLMFPKLQYFLPLIPPTLDGWDIGKYTVLLSSSSSFIKNLRKPKNCLHICYCHTPTRFLWHDHDYISQELPWFLYPVKPLIRWILKRMRGWDFAKAQQVDFFIANSKEVQKRIKEYYGRESVVIYPPVDTEFWGSSLRVQTKQFQGPQIAAFAMAANKQDYFLLAGRLQAHKKNDLIIEIFNELGLPLHVVGTGRQERQLRAMAKPNITFYGRVSDDELRSQYQNARGFIYPQIEDAGLMPLEAAACGTATIAIAKGGSLETVIPGVTGELFGLSGANTEQNKTADQSANYKEQIKQIVLNWNTEKYSVEVLRAHAEKFGKEKFKQGISEFVKTHHSRS